MTFYLAFHGQVHQSIAILNRPGAIPNEENQI